ncbi:transcription antitermination factor NusB [Enterovirga aerilata]|uniref:RsmB/NOP family class I SAM-dependent RNA methyltransferase n=1 Tax=Enterovirga aerilata TaxID=2730920 RepID=A0A849I1B1_9HYPH|nr:RsmB/NOP family class I SAM-dependent RNA methyltransferase [Enterovirga sp. DB1703]
MTRARRSGRSEEGPPAAAEPAGFGARRLALAAVAEVLRSRTGLDEILARSPGADPLARAVAVTTFRRLGTLGRVLNERLAKGLSADERAFALLATGAAQILFLNVPDHAAVDLTVELARSDPKLRHLTGVANAVLRRVAREREAILAEEISPLEDAPVWLAERWTGTYGPERAAAMAAAHRDGAPVDLSAKEDAAGWAERLGGALLPSGSIRLADRTAIPDLPGYAEGAWWVQDAAAALPARLLGAGPGERVADLCAAPGGKTAQLAAAGAVVTAVDRSAARLGRLRQNLDRLRLGAEVVCTDALAFRAEPFDAVLLDAPCTATGTLRRHPDAAWTKQEGDLASLADLQRRLLDHAATLVRPGGRLVYCVCSLEPEEGEQQAAAFLRRHPEFERIPVAPGETGLGQAVVTDEGDLRTLPDAAGLPEAFRRGLDGFFACRVSRKPA